ncbi:putative transposable element [Trichonephila clavipes]|nr:putative transposable element [Trichonephila clavipes]
MELSRIANQSANQNNGQTSRVKSLDEIVKMVRLLTVKVPNKLDGWEYFFSSLEKAFASEMVSDELKPRKNFDKGQVTEIKKFACFTCGSDKHFERDCPKNKEVDNKRLNENKVSTEGTELVDGTVAARVDLLDGKLVHALLDSGTEITVIKKDLVPGISVEGASTIYLKRESTGSTLRDSQRNITSCRNEVGTLGTKDEEMTAEMDKGIMVADSFRSEQECCAELALAWKDKILGESIGQLVIPKCRRTEVLRLAHTSVFSSHMGPKKTLERIKYSLFWEGLSSNVKKFCESCKECQRTRSVRIKDRSPITPVARSELPFQVVNMDLIGQLIRQAQRDIHIFYVWLISTLGGGEARPVTSLSAKELSLEQSSRLLTVAIIVCSVCGFSVTRFVERAQNEIAVVPDFHKRILFSDEAHFWLNGYVNKQNCRIWREANPQVYAETSLHPKKLTVWCALWAGGIIGPYFFKDDEGHNVTVNGDRYRAMIISFFIPELNNHDVQELWFQQDGATCHTARATIALLKDTFGDRLISRFGPVNWPPRSCDLTPLDYFLWGYVKSLVYADKPQTLDHLDDNIRRVIADTRPQMLEKVIENWTSRLDYIRVSRGSHMPEIIFSI